MTNLYGWCSGEAPGQCGGREVSIICGGGVTVPTLVYSQHLALHHLCHILLHHTEPGMRDV